MSNDTEPTSDTVPLHPRQQSIWTVRMLGSVLQLLSVAICMEMLVGISDGAGMLLRLFFFVVVMMGVVVRIGWLSLVAIQFSLLLQEPRGGRLAQAPAGFFWITVAMLTIIAAMKLPQSHRAITDYILRIAGIGTVPLAERSNHSSQGRFIAIASIGVQVFQLLVVVIVAIFALVNIPIGQQSGRWLQSSIATGQAFWPGTFWLVVIVALFVLAREIAWRKIDGPQASLYLRSVQLIAHYRDLIRFERARVKQMRMESEKIDPTMHPVKMRSSARTSKMLNRNKQDKTDAKGSA